MSIAIPMIIDILNVTDADSVHEQIKDWKPGIEGPMTINRL